MFFYRIGAYGYEESYQSIYMSNKEYSQKDFEDILFSAYEKLCYKLLDEVENSPCFYNIYFTVEYSIFSKEFDELLEKEHDLIKVDNNNLTAFVGFNLTHDGNEKPNTHRLCDILVNLDLDTSCINDCSRIKDESVRERQMTRKDCLVTKILENKKKLGE